MHDKLKQRILAKYPDWHQHPLRLTISEIENPYTVLSDFYSCYSLTDIRACLKTWLDDALQAENLQASGHVSTYDHIEKLAEASYILYKNSTASRKIDSSEEINSNDAFIRFIINIIQPEKIFGVHYPDRSKGVNSINTDLLIIVPDSCQKPFSEFETLVEVCLLNNQTITFSLHKSADLYNHLAAGHIFYSSVCTTANLVYDNGKTALPQALLLKNPEIAQKATSDFEAGHSKAASFMEGAKMYLDKDEKALTAFMLQQATELTLRALIQSLTGSEIRTHSIYTFKKYCKRYAPELNTIFPDNTEGEEKLLQLLEKAYLQARYAPSFQIHKDTLETLMQRVALFIETAKQLFERTISVYTSKINYSNTK